MELSLKLVLTDEQYKDLMDKSFDTVINSPQVQTELQSIIVSTMKDHIESWFNANADNVIIETYSLSRYDNANKRQFVERMTKDVGEQYKKQLAEIIMKHMVQLTEKAPIDKILTSLLLNAILKGATGGLQEWSTMVSANSAFSADILQNIVRDLHNVGIDVCITNPPEPIPIVDPTI